MKAGPNMKISSNKWVSFEKIFVVLALIVSIVLSVVIGLIVASGRVQALYEYSVIAGIGIIVIGILVSFASVAMLMIYLTMAQDIRDIRNILLMREEARAARSAPQVPAEK